MKITAVRTIVTAALSVELFASGALAQIPPQVSAQAPEAAPAQAAPALAPAALDQMLAPIALYPDPLIAQILMAATYPLEIVEAHRWLQDPNNAALSGDALAAALTNQPWDPSVKSLVAFPQVLAMMDGILVTRILDGERIHRCPLPPPDGSKQPPPQPEGMPRWGVAC